MRKKESAPNIPRNTLTKERVIEAAIKLADAGGIEALSMRKLGRNLGVEGMAIYHHFENKDQLIEGMLDKVHEEITIPVSEKDWKIFMAERAKSVLEVLSAHPWAASLMESGINPGPATLQDREDILRCFREAGFSIDMAVHAITVLDIFVYGFAQQNAKLSFSNEEQATELGKNVLAQFPSEKYPYMAEMIRVHMMETGYSAMKEFEFGLNLILEGIARSNPTS